MRRSRAMGRATRKNTTSNFFDHTKWVLFSLGINLNNSFYCFCNTTLWLSGKTCTEQFKCDTDGCWGPTDPTLGCSQYCTHFTFLQPFFVSKKRNWNKRQENTTEHRFHSQTLSQLEKQENPQVAPYSAARCWKTVENISMKTEAVETIHRWHLWTKH